MPNPRGLGAISLMLDEKHELGAGWAKFDTIAPSNLGLDLADAPEREKETEQLALCQERHRGPDESAPPVVLRALRQLLASQSVVLLGALLMFVAACSADDVPSKSCTEGDRILNVGFYAFFNPVSYSADPDPASEGFDIHLGYEADLLTALESIDGAGLSFSRRGIAPWDDIWLLSAGPEYDIVGGGHHHSRFSHPATRQARRSSHSRRAT